MKVNITQVELNNETLDWSLFLEIRGESIEIPLESSKPISVLKLIKPYEVTHVNSSTYYVPVNKQSH